MNDTGILLHNSSLVGPILTYLETYNGEKPLYTYSIPYRVGSWDVMKKLDPGQGGAWMCSKIVKASWTCL